MIALISEKLDIKTSSYKIICIKKRYSKSLRMIKISIKLKTSNILQHNNMIKYTLKQIPDRISLTMDS